MKRALGFLAAVALWLPTVAWAQQNVGGPPILQWGGMAPTASNAVLPDARYAIGPNNACNPVTDKGADPTGVVDASTAINNCAAVTKNGQSVNVYLPAGTYHVAHALNIGAGQCLYGDGRGNTTLSVDQGFDSAATGVIVLTGREQLSPCVHDLTIAFAQPTDQGTRGNFKTLTQGCTSSLGGTGCKYPPAIYVSTSNRFKLWRLRISSAWDGINATAASPNAPGGFFIEDIELGALDVGLAIDNAADFCHVRGIHFWDFGFNSSTALYTGVFQDGSTISGQFGRCDGIDVDDFSSFTGKIQLTSTFTFGQFRGIKLDGSNSDLQVAATTSTGLQLTGLYGSGLPSGSNCKFGVAGGTVQASNIDIASQTTNAICISGSASFISNNATILTTGTPAGLKQDSSGVVRLTGYSFSGPNSLNNTQSLSCNNCRFAPSATNGKAAAQTGGLLEIFGSRFAANTGAGSWTVPLITTTGAATIIFQGNSFNTAGTNVGSLSLVDNAVNLVAGNVFNGWTFTPPGTLGAYGLSCSGSPTASFASVNGVVTAC